MLDGVRAARPAWWLLALGAAVAADLLTFVVPRLRGGAFALFPLLGAVLMLWIAYAVLRRMAGTPGPFALAPAAWRFAAFEFGMRATLALLSLAVARSTGLAEQPLARQWLSLFLLAAVWGIATIRLIGVPAALANGQPFAAAADAIRETRGHAAGLAACFAQLILPFAAIHAAFVLLALRLPLTPPALAALALLDGAVSGAQLLLSAALSHAAWRIGARRFP